MVLNQEGRALETHRIPVISTGHVDYPTAQTLNTHAGRDLCPVAAWEYGFFLYLEEEMEDDKPQCLRDISAWLTKHKFTDRWVRLEADASKADGLTSYDW